MGFLLAILPESIEEVKSIANVYDVISEYLDLKKVGNSYSALCPFHSEKTPSFYVSPQKNIWKCFGCGKSGNAISFLMEYEGLSYSQAIEKLAEKYGIQLRYTNTEKEKSKKKILNVLQEVALFYKEQLKNYPEPRKYLTDRGVLPSTIDKFDLGYSPDDRSLLEFTAKKGIDTELLKKAGIVSQSGKDLFSGRVIFPIKDIQGRVVAFGGRSLKDKASPKYLNSPETEVYHKGQTLYGLFEAKDSIKEEGFAVLVEGYFDVILPHQVGFKNFVASLGTGFTQQQAKLLKKFTNKVYILFDSDRAGKKAALTAAKICLAYGIEVFYKPISDGKDPDELARTDSKRLKEHLLQAKPILDFLVERLREERQPEKKKRLISIILDLIATAEDKLMVGEYLNKLSNITKIPYELLTEELKKYKGSLNIKEEEKHLISEEHLSTNEKIILKGLILYKNDVLNLINRYEKIKGSEYFKYLISGILNEELSEKEYEEIINFKVPASPDIVDEALKQLHLEYKKEELLLGELADFSENYLMDVYKLVKSLKGGKQ